MPGVQSNEINKSERLIHLIRARLKQIFNDFDETWEYRDKKTNKRIVPITMNIRYYNMFDRLPYELHIPHRIRVHNIIITNDISSYHIIFALAYSPITIKIRARGSKYNITVTQYNGKRLRMIFKYYLFITLSARKSLFIFALRLTI